MKLVREYHNEMVECAAKLAPYIHPRLAAVEVKTKQSQAFVIRTPPVDRAARESRAGHDGLRQSARNR
jgi:hypothetical protein